MSGPRSRHEPPRHEPPAIHQAWTPYLSESDHVFSLQHPTAPVSPAAGAMASLKSQKSSESIVVSPSSKSHRLVDVPENDSPESLAQLSLKTASPASPLLSPRVLYLKAKKEIEWKLKQKQHQDSYIRHPTHADSQLDATSRTDYSCNDLAPDEDCRTQATVEGTKKFLASQSISKTGTWFKDELHTSKIGRKLFGKAPWHRKESGDSFTSVSSSIRAVLKGKTPPATPANYGLSFASAQTHSQPKMTIGAGLILELPGSCNLSNSQFPGGEAVRVSTPPMDEDTADGKPRAFFTSLTPPRPDGETSTKTASSSTHSTKRFSIHGSSMVSQPREWWEQIPQRGCRRDTLGTAGSSVNKFDLDIPEHLPGSPMCPADKRHKSGGTGVCAYHGRRITRSTMRE
ncbi:hypothetical protein Trco_000579 [Trichoderma cornu-damae]|uniref:Uncharacterized protein n=1 Tax=Trichoderma cornu-damae TaxID=654480 RepID=A0A9P8QSM8_9HYPO|nr:hypothetical protein Trco_000579 [Trichoderma cornu-damae]